MQLKTLKYKQKEIWTSKHLYNRIIQNEKKILIFLLIKDIENSMNFNEFRLGQQIKCKILSLASEDYIRDLKG